MRCNLTVNTKTAYLNTDIVFECDSQSVRLKDYLTGQEYYVKRKLKIRLIAGKHDFLCIDNGEKFSIFVHDAIKLGGGRIKALASYIDDECPWIILTTSDRMYGHNRLTGYEFIEHKLTTGSIKWLRNDIFLLQSSSENIIIDVLTKRILLSARNILFCNAKFAIYKTHYKSIILYNVFDITSEEIIISTEYPVSITTIDGSENVLFYVKDLNVRRLNLETKNDEKIEVSLYDKFIQINRWSLNSFENYIIARDKIIDLINGRNKRSLKLDELASVSIFGKFLQGNRLLFNFFKQYIIVNDEIINLINGKCNKIPLIEGCRITKIFNTGSDGYVNEVSITRIDTTINDLIVWYEVLLHENKKICKKRVRADIYNGTYEFVNSIPYQNLAEQRCVLERNYNNVILPQICSGKSITCSRQGNLFLYENYGKIYFYDKRNEESYLILEDLYDSTNCQNAFFTTDGKNLIISDTGNSLKLYDIEGGKYNSFEIKEFTSFKFFKGVYNGYIPELSIRINPSDCTKPIWKDPFSLKTIDPYELKEFAYVSSDGHYVAESKIEREYVNLISGNTIKGEEYNQLVQLYDFTKNGREEEIIKNRKDLCRNNFFANKYTVYDISNLESFTRLFIEKRCWLNIHDKLTNKVRRIFIGVNVTYLNYVSFSYDSRYVAIGGKIYEGSNQPGIFVLYDLVDDKYIVEGSWNELQAVWMTLFNKIGDCAFYDSAPNTYIYSMSSNYTKRIMIENRSLLCFSPSGKYLALSSQGYTRYSDNDVNWGHQLSTMVSLYSIEQNKEISVFNDFANNVRGVKKSNNVAIAAFSSDEKRLMILGDDGVIVIRNLSGIVPTYKSTGDDVGAVPLGVREIKAEEFLGNTSLKRVVIPNSVTRIGEGAFYGCTSLESIEIPDSVIEIERCAFAKCSKLRHVTLPKHLSRIAEGLFLQCSSLEGLVLPNGVQMIGLGAFGNCTTLEDIEIPNSVTNIGKLTFAECSSLRKVVIPNSVAKIGAGAFQGCASLESIEIPDSIIDIERYAFAKCPKLRNITLPKHLSKIATGLFWQCSSLEGVVIPNSVKDIAGNAFCNVKSIKSFSVSESNQYFSSIDGILYSKDMTTLKRVPIAKNLHFYRIPETITKIGAYAFCGCTVECVEIPSGVIEIGSRAFDFNQINELHINIKDIMKCTIDDEVFGNEKIFDTCVLYVPSGAYSIYKRHPIFSKFRNYLAEDPPF